MLQNDIFTIIGKAVDALQQAGEIAPGGMIVLGCSTSEVAGARIGKGSVPELGQIIASAMLEACRKRGLYAAFQCCEHLNRAIVMEQEALDARRLTQVKAVPQPKAGGSVPAAAWKLLSRPALAVNVQADAAIDIGDTLVGMHIRPVAVPLRMEENRIGHANLVMAYSRLPFIGGSRAVYE
ncbi:MAG: TIGR01440 family protein [Clostridiales bacterium]|nr:TIGR01440 family protein [Clostridiales bacterium]